MNGGISKAVMEESAHEPIVPSYMVISVETQLRLISAGRVRGGGTLGAKKGAAEPTGMYSRRVPTPRTRAVAS